MANLALKPLGDVPAWLSSDGTDLAQQLASALNSKVHKERWKYTNAQPVLDLLWAETANSDISPLVAGVTLHTVKPTDSESPIQGQLATAPEAYAALCLHSDVNVLTVAQSPDEPLVLQHHGSSNPWIIRVADNVTVELQEHFSSSAETQQQTVWIELGSGSQVRHARNAFNTGKHWQFLHVNVARDATYQLNNHASGAQLRRQDIQITCADQGAHAEIISAAAVKSKQHLDQQITLEHRAAHSTSNQVFHNIAAAEAKVTFNGRIHIHENCPGVNAELSNKNLCMGDNAKINTKPELEIYTDDVKCAHGTTIGRLDDDHLFYCASRGINPEQARALLAQAFLEVCTQGPLADAAGAYFAKVAEH